MGQGLGYLKGQRPATIIGCPNSINQLTGRHIFEQVADSSGSQGLLNQILIRKAGQHNNPDQRAPLTDCIRSVSAIHAGHDHIH